MKRKNKQPLVSVIMPAYNSEQYIAKALNSVLGQTYRNFEIIVVDDASGDETGSIVRAYRERYPKLVKYIRLKRNHNHGGDSAANEGLKRARGIYIARMDADDIAAPQRLEKQVAYLESHRDTFLVGTHAYVIDSADNTVGEKKEPLTANDIKKQFFTVHPLIHPSVMYRRLLKSGKPFLYKTKYNANNDYYTFFSLLCSGYTFANLPEKLLFYRIHNASMTYSNLKGNFMNTVKIRQQMISVYHYHASLKDIAVMMAQAAVVLPLPNNLLTQLYVLARGFRKPAVPSIMPVLQQPSAVSLARK